MYQILVISNNPTYTNELKRASMLSNADIIRVCYTVEDVRSSLMSGARPDAIIASDVLYPGTTVESIVQELSMANLLNKTYFVLHNPDVSDFLMSNRIQFVFENATPPENLLRMIFGNAQPSQQTYNPYNGQGTAQYNPYEQQNKATNNPYTQNYGQPNSSYGQMGATSATANQYVNNPYEQMGTSANQPTQQNRQFESAQSQNMANRFAHTTESHATQQNSYSVNEGRLGAAGGVNFKPIMITINSPKGGVGKTSLSIELAFLLAARAKEVDFNPTSKLNYSRGVQVCLVDLNPSFDTMAATLECVRSVPNYPTVTDWVSRIEEKIFNYLTDEEKHKLMEDPRHDFAKYIREDDIRFTREEIEQLLVKDEQTGLYILPSISLPFDVNYVKPEYVRIILRQLKAMFDVVIADTGNNISFFTVQAMREANEVFLVTNQTAASSVVLGKLTKNLERLGLDPSKFNLVVNNPNGGENELEPETIAQVLKLTLISVFPYDAGIKDAHERGVPYAIYHKRAPFTKEAVKLAQQICPLWKTVKRKPGSQKKKGFFGK